MLNTHGITEELQFIWKGNVAIIKVLEIEKVKDLNEDTT